MSVRYASPIQSLIDELRRRPKAWIDSVEDMPGLAELPDFDSDPADLILSQEIDTRLQQALSVRMFGSPEQIIDRRRFDDLTRIHDDDTLGKLCDHTEIVSNHDQRSASVSD